MQPRNRIAEARRVAWADESARESVAAGLAGSIDIICHGHDSAEQRLWDGAWEALARTGVRQDIHRANESGDTRGRDEAGEDDLRGLVFGRVDGAIEFTHAEAERSRFGGESFAPPAIADPQEPPGGMCAKIGREGVEQIIVPFVLRESRDGSDDEGILREAEASADFSA